MITGNKARFAIEAVPRAREGRWISGHFRFWIAGEPVGDWEDYADLRACANWLTDFASSPTERYKPTLERLPASEILRLVWDVNMMKPRSKFTSDDIEIEDAYSRFYLSHLGMSAFDHFDIILVFTSLGEERLVWRDGREGRVGEVRLGRGEMEAVAKEASDAIYAELAAFEEP